MNLTLQGWGIDDALVWIACLELHFPKNNTLVAMRQYLIAYILPVHQNVVPDPDHGEQIHI